MNIELEEYYEKKKKQIAYQTDYIEGEQYNFTLDDIQDMLNITDLELFKKYVYYLDVYKVTYTYIQSYEDSIMKFITIINSENEIIKNRLLRIFLKHEDLFKDERGLKRLKLIPKKYEKRLFVKSFV